MMVMIQGLRGRTLSHGLTYGHVVSRRFLPAPHRAGGDYPPLRSFFVPPAVRESVLRACSTGPNGLPFSIMGEDATVGGDRPETRRRYTVTEAAEILGITVEAVRGRIKRGTIEHERTDEGVFVWIDADRPPTSSRPDEDRPDDRTQLVEALKNEISHLREQLAAERDANSENRRLLAAALERIPAIEAPEASESSESTGETSDTAAEPQSTSEEPQEATSRPQERSWWRRMFGS
jgi:hypothetical protein